MDNSGETEIDVDLEYPDDVDIEDVVATLTLHQSDKYMKSEFSILCALQLFLV